MPPVAIGDTMRGWAIGKIIASKSKIFPVGSLATGFPGWVELVVAKEGDLEKVDYLPENGKLTDAMGVLGMIDNSSLTAQPITSSNFHEQVSLA
jgi:NADPH-dependent curcumin reductase CurA